MIIAILSASAIVQMASWAVAQQTAKPVTRDDAADRVHRVFIPVDEKEQPTNDQYPGPRTALRRVAATRGRRFGNDRRVPGSRRAIPAFGQPRRDERRTRADRRACAIRRARAPAGHDLAIAGHRRVLRSRGAVATAARSTWSGTRTRMASHAVSSSRGCISLTCRCEISVSKRPPTRSILRFRPCRRRALRCSCRPMRRRSKFRRLTARRTFFGRRPYAVRATWSRGPLIPALGPRPPVAQPTDRRRCRHLAVAASAAGVGRTARPAGYKVIENTSLRVVAVDRSSAPHGGCRSSIVRARSPACNRS